MSYRHYKSAARDLISYVYHHGGTIQVDMDWDDWETMPDAAKAWEEVNAVDGGSDFRVFDKHGAYQGIVILAIGYNAHDEEVCDFSDTRYINDWFDDYIKRY